MNIHTDSFRTKMAAHQISELRIERFEETLNILQSGETGMIPESDIVPAKDVLNYKDLPHSLGPLDQVAMIKLNGGLGTSMGLDKPKSLLPVKGSDTFLDIVIKQVIALGKEAGSAFPLLLMNSYSTSQASLEVLAKYPGLQQDLPFEFLQSKVPKIDVATGKPAEWPDNSELEWCPPGHGDIYLSLLESGLIKQLLGLGIKYAFVSNIDNLGATVDPRILAHFAESQAPFLMEVTRRTPADKKGGHLASSPQGQLLLREVAQCPKSDVDKFQDIDRHQFFNTNNLWLNLEKIESQLKSVSLPLIINRKTVDPADPSSPAVIQSETAMGSAIAVFEGSIALDVPRSRFAPVKKTSDLMLIRSNLFELGKDFVIRATQESMPKITLSDEYKFIQNFEAKIPSDIDLSECTEIQFKGEVVVEAGTKFVGAVHLEAQPGETLKVEGLVSETPVSQ